MASTAQTAFVAAFSQSVQDKVLQNLRAKLVWADPGLADQGTFNKASDTITFTAVPDLSNTTPQTPLTEGSAPTARAITMTTVSFSTNQYGDLVQITDLAKVKAPWDVSTIASERVSRVAAEVIDIISRDSIFVGGTPFYSVVSANVIRTDVASTDIMTAAALPKLYATMKKAKLPAYDDGFYRLYLSPGQVYDLMADTTATTSIREPSKYTDMGRNTLITGERGEWNGFRIIEVQGSGIPTFSSTTTVYAGLACGPIKGWGAGELQTLRTYHVAPGGDHSDPLAQIEQVGYC